MRIVTVTDALDGKRMPTNGVKVASALRRLGHEVSRIDHNGITREALEGAGLVLSFGTVVRAESQNPGYFVRINEAKDAVAVSALWYFDMCNPRQRHAPYKPVMIKRAAEVVDWLVTTDHSYPWEQHAKNYLFLPQGVDPDEFAWSVCPPEPRTYDVIFTGGCDAAFAYRRRYIDVLRTRFRVSAFGRGHTRRVFGADFFAAHQRSRVALVPPPPHEARDHYWSNRIFLAAATGTPCLVGYVPGIEDYYREGEEVAYFRKTSECVPLAKALIDDPQLREAMGAAARKRTLTEHSYDSRARTLMDAIFGEGTTH
jgi:hypothetical protein